MKKEQKMYSKKQLKFLRVKYRTLPRRRLVWAFNAKFNIKKTETQIKLILKNHHIKSGRTGYFKSGNQPWNAGSKGLMRRNITSFKKGQVPKNRQPLGAERIDVKDGFILIKIAERDPFTGSVTRYKLKHVYIWEQKYGKVPAGMVVSFKDSDRLNCRLSNLMLISRSMLLRLNAQRYSELPVELKPSVLALVKLKDKIFKITGKAQKE